MKRAFFSREIPRALLIGLAPAVVSGVAFAWQPGTYPKAPAVMHSSGFQVDNFDRNDVVAFWHAVYQASEGYQGRVGWTGNYTGNPGKTSAAFAADVERRVNYFRAMCGVPARVKVNGPSGVVVEKGDPYRPSPAIQKAAAAQAAALMLVRSYDPGSGSAPGMTHNPPKSLPGWSAAVWNAAAKSNLGFGLFGPGAITEYMVEEYGGGSLGSVWNTSVGHRRWVVFPPATQFGSGDQPGAGANRPPTNVLYITQKPSELVPVGSVGFVAFPPAGFFPAPINSRSWSLSRAGADFSSATVRVTDFAGRMVPVSGVQTNAGFGDPAIIWEVGGNARSRSVYLDTRYDVVVSGIKGKGIPPVHRYSVTLIHPDRLLSDQSLRGPVTAVSNKSTKYTFTPPAGAEAIEVTAFQRKPANWIESAEVPAAAKVIDRTAKSYSLIENPSKYLGFGPVAGGSAFRLTFPILYDLILRGVPEQSFELDREILTKPGARLQFVYRRGFMTPGTSLAVEYSTDGGVLWKPLGKAITGVSETRMDAASTVAGYAIPQSIRPTRIRFRYWAGPRVSVYTHDAAPNSATGIFIDDIRLVSCDWLDPRKVNRLPKHATSMNFRTSTAGGALIEGGRWVLAMRAQLGRKWFPYGPPKTIRITAP